MSETPPNIATDRECLEAFSRRPGAETLRPVVERYLAFVYSSALRRAGDAAQAAEVTRAVFLVLAHRAGKLRKKTVLANWLFQITGLVFRKIKPRRTRLWRWFSRKPRRELPPDATLWDRVAPEIDSALERLTSKQRDAVLLCRFLNYDSDFAAKILRSRERRVSKRIERGLKKIAKRLRRCGVKVDSHSLATACATHGRAPIPHGLDLEILAMIEENKNKRPAFKLARRALNTLAWKRWRRRLAIGVPSLLVLLIASGCAAWHIDGRTGHSRLISAFIVWSVKNEARTVPGLAQPARPWPTNGASTRLNAASIRSARDLYQTTNIWLAHLKFSREQWKALQPKRIGALPNFLQPDDTALLRNPRAQRSGLAGVLGYDFHWTHADFEFGGVAFTNAAARLKGNGTWLGSLSGNKRAFKVDLNKFADGQKLGDVDEMAFNNLIADYSSLSDALAYEFFRDADVPAPRTAYAWLTVSAEGKWDRKPLGLYVMVEPVDAEFAAEHFDSKKAPVFKPVTYQLFEYMGDDWLAYTEIYDLKTKATVEQKRRVIDFARLVSSATDAEFAERLGNFLDLDEFARFLAGEVLLSSYDGILSDGQNFYVYLDPRSNKFGFIPWDLDLAWGNFFLLGTKTERERASIWHPWVGQNRFLERVMAVEEFRKIYRAHLEDFSARLFVPSRLNQRIDELAAVIRSPVAAESDFRLDKFDQAVGNKPLAPSRGNPQSADRPAHQLKRFIEKRAISVRQQLDGKSKGMILKRGENK
jgi:RNA polymerase sigma factor (sigma-70 family)